MRYDNWKIVFLEQRCHGTLQVWAEPFTRLRLPKLYNLRTDPYEYADITSNTYWDWYMLAADIVRTAIAPSWDDIGQLAAIAVIRTFLNYFLERDLEAAIDMKAGVENPAEAPCARPLQCSHS